MDIDSVRETALKSSACYGCLRDLHLLKRDDGSFRTDPFVGIGGSYGPPFKIVFYDYPFSKGTDKLLYCPTCLHVLHRYLDECIAMRVRGRIQDRLEWEESLRRKKEKRRKHNARRKDVQRQRKTQ